MLPHRWPILLVAFSLSSLGCNSKPAPVAPASPLVPREDEPVSEEECRKFAARLEQAVRENDREELEELLRLDGDAILTISIPLADDRQPQYALEWLADQVVQAVKDGGRYKLLRIRNVNGHPKALFRLTRTDGQFAYHEFRLHPSFDGTTSLRELYLFAFGEDFGLHEMNMEFSIVPFPEEAPKVRAMLRAKNPSEAASAYKSLPANLRDNRAVAILHLQKVAGDEAEFVNSFENFRRLFRKDPALDFWSIAYWRLKKDYDAALKAVDKLDSILGGDPYLHVQRSGILVEAGRVQEAKAAAEKAVSEEPSLPSGYRARVGIALKEKNYSEGLLWLKKMVENTDDEVPDLTKAPEYAEFRKSPEFMEWLKWHEGKKRGPVRG